VKKGRGGKQIKMINRQSLKALQKNKKANGRSKWVMGSYTGCP